MDEFKDGREVFCLSMTESVVPRIRYLESIIDRSILATKPWQRIATDCKKVIKDEGDEAVYILGCCRSSCRPISAFYYLSLQSSQSATSTVS